MRDTFEEVLNTLDSNEAKALVEAFRNKWMDFTSLKVESGFMSEVMRKKINSDFIGLLRETIHSITTPALTVKDSKERRFWLVWCENTKEVRYKHHTYHQAKLEAERLAKRHSGHKFYVVAAIGLAQTVDTIYEEF
jgi:hypothetical protein